MQKLTDNESPSSSETSLSAPDPFAGPDWGGGERSASGQRIAPSKKRIKVSRRKRRRRRRIGLAMAMTGGLILLAGLWLVVTALLARGQLNQVRASVQTLRAQVAVGDIPAARTTATQLASHAHRAHWLTSGPVWAVASHLPSVGLPLQTARGVTASIDAIGTDALPQLVTATAELDPAKLRNADGSIDLSRIADVSPALTRASAAMALATTTIAGLPAHTWLPTMDVARIDVLTQLTSLGHTIRSADLAARIAPPMLGQDGPKSYLISFQNEAELRGTGGLPGAFAIVKADRGKLTFTGFESDSVLTSTKSGLDFGSDFNQLYAGANAMDEYADSNVSPHFPYAARIWVAMWQKFSGQRLDGAIALDPTALSYLLQVVGPATMPDKALVTAANVVDLTQRTLYSKFATDPPRKQYLLDIARAVGTHLLTGAAGDTHALINAAGRAAGERRLMAWSSDSSVEADLVQTALGGAVPMTTEPFVGVALNNSSANKIDYYLGAALTWQRVGCGSTRSVTLTMTITNNAPANLPAYVLGWTGRPGYPARPGDDRVLISYFATQDAVLTKISVNGVAASAAIGAELGHPVFTTNLELPRGASQTVVIHLTEPAGSVSPVVMKQPMVRPIAVTIDDQVCG